MSRNLKKQYEKIVDGLKHFKEDGFKPDGFKPAVVEALIEIKKIIKKYEKPYRVMFVPETEYFTTLEKAKNSKFYGSKADIETLCVNGKWVKIR